MNLTWSWDNLIPYYKIVKYKDSRGVSWGISERILLFFFTPLKHLKVVWRGDVNTLHWRENLTWPTEEEAMDEMDRLYFGEAAVTKRVWKDGKLVEESYY